MRMTRNEFLATFPPCEGKSSIMQPGNWVWYDGAGHVVEEVEPEHVTIVRMRKRRITAHLIEQYEDDLARKPARRRP